LSRRRVSLRVRLTALYVGLFGGAALLLIGASYLLLRGHLRRTLPAPLADDALSSLAGQYALALAGVLLVATVLGWIAAGRVLAPLARITAGAREISRDRLDRRIALAGPRDELRELADTFDAMLDRLEAAFAAQDRFVANASHELRSPLTVIRAEAEVALADPDAGVEELRAAAEAILRATDRMQALLEGLLTLATSQRGLARREPVDFADALRAAAHAVGPEAREAGVALRVGGGGSAWVDGDRELLQRLAENLLENGVRYNAPGGFVSVHTGARDGAALLRVVNSGPRVAPETAERLLEPFERGGRARDDRGAGLGLSIVRSVAEAHGGRVGLSPRREGGLSVEVVLPRG
jgi:signal transduction histidine kinase